MNVGRLLTRRNAILAGLTAAGGLLLHGRSKPLPPTYGHILRMGDNLTYAAHRLLLPGQSMAREYSRTQITPFPAVFIKDSTADTHPMSSAEYRRLRAGGFADWRLWVGGLVARRGPYSLADLKRLPARTQITRHTCEEGWSAIGEWTGVQLSRVLEAAGMLPEARYVTFHCADTYVDSIDLLDALHPQTLLAYGMNGRDLSVPHGAPVRLRLETQMGYKSMKYVARIEVKNELEEEDIEGTIQDGWSWYAGI
ncbi:MAG: molybdopterin-dependent oxidoreductase [Planctomycetes bacterium]|jgi:DMSO/TMAO reductase YedYZ molybdopterin-dependent catalytic subunit|nr:molybdopterin-dependent oxidoreductase [Planctomycetota bacterium]